MLRRPRLALALCALLLAGAAAFGQNPNPPSAVHVAAAFVPTVGTYGPSASIGCPVGALNVATGDNLQTLVTANAAGTAFCLRAGVHPITSAITPKSGDTFVGEFGAIVDGTGWATADTTQAAFRANNEDIDDVTIRNLVIRNMPQGGVRAFRDYSDRWIVEYTEIGNNAGTGINAPHNGIVRNNYIHHNTVSGYAAYLSNYALFENNQFSYNGNESKISQTRGTIFRTNYIHHSVNGIWYDGENTQSTIEGNTIEDNSGYGVFYEVSGQGVIRNNTIRRNGDNGIFISTSHSVEISGNVIEDNYRGITYFIDCSRVNSPDGGYVYPGHFSEEFYMQDVSAHNNVMRLGSGVGVLAAGLGYTSCTGPELAVYTGGSKNLVFTANAYYAPNTTSTWFYWGGVSKTFTQWQSIPQDVSGSIAVR